MVLSRRSLQIAVALSVLCVAGIVVTLASLKMWLPTSEEIRGCLTTSMYQVNLCPGSKEYVPLKSISKYLQKTIVLTEDSNFFNHSGFEWHIIEKNFREGWETGSFKKGGSTISQQLAKNMFLSADRTFIRKGLEALITDQIEKTLTKNEILERYLNVVEFGKNIYGSKAAAAHYFQKSPADLDVVESAFLAMLLPNPIKYSQSFYKKELTPFARKRMSEIIENMYRYHRINDDEYTASVEKFWGFLNPHSLGVDPNASEEDALLGEIEKALESELDSQSDVLTEQPHTEDSTLSDTPEEENL